MNEKNTALLAAADVMNYVFLRECFNSKYESTIVHEGVLDFFTQMSEEDIYYEPFKDACETEFEEGEYALGTLEETLDTLRSYVAAHWGSDFSEDLFAYRFYKEIVTNYFNSKAKALEPTRDEILAPFFVKRRYTVFHREFDGVDAETLEKLIAGGHLDPHSRQKGQGKQNDSLSAEEILDFVKENNKIAKANGYITSYARREPIMIINGVSVDLSTLSLEEKLDFVIEFYRVFNGADTCEVDLNSDTGLADWWN